MARRFPDDRFERLIDCAADVFIDRGYRRTQMADVAAALGVARGTLYLYVESKEALFDLVARYADADRPTACPSSPSGRRSPAPRSSTFGSGSARAGAGEPDERDRAAARRERTGRARGDGARALATPSAATPTPVRSRRRGPTGVDRVA